MVQVQDDNYIQPEVTITSSPESGTYTFGTKPKRKRKEWVYKTEYDKLQEKYEVTKAIAFIGWIVALSLTTIMVLQ